MILLRSVRTAATVSILLPLLRIHPCAAGGPKLPESVRTGIPPQRAAFDVSPTIPIHLGKLWGDLGYFYNFPYVARAQWEARFFAAMNQAVLPGANLRQLLAASVGALCDPSALVLDPAEGQGGNFLPVLFEGRRDGVWIVGGSHDAVSSAFGPVMSINGKPIADFLADRIGPKPSQEQVVAALAICSIRTNAFSWEFRSPAGVLTVASTTKLPTDVWITGGWDGLPLHALDALPKPDLQAIRKIDLRAAPWFRCDSIKLSNPARQVLEQLSGMARSNPVMFHHRFHKGPSDGSPWSWYQDRFLSEPAPFIEQPSAKTRFETRACPAGALPVGVAGDLAGWALDAGGFHPKELARYKIDGQDVVYPVQVYGPTISYSNRAYPGPTWGALPALGFSNGKTLTRPAAIALAAAAIINFDHYFGFTPEEWQGEFANGVIGLTATVKSVPELILKTGPLNREPHSHNRLRLRGIMTDPAEKVRHPDSIPFRQLPLLFFSPTADELLVLRATRDVPGLPLVAGARILSIEGRSTKEWLRDAAAINPGRPDDSLRLGIELFNLFPDKDSLAVEYRLPGDNKVQTCALPYLTIADARKAWKPVQQQHPALPAGWAYIADPTSISLNDLMKRVAAGENILVDTRFGSIFKRPANWLRLTNYGERVRMPDGPFPWGKAKNHTLAMHTYTREFEANADLMKPKGRLVLITWGAQQSMEESYLVYARLAEDFGNKVFLVGLPTAGITGPAAELRLPIGVEDGFASYSQTGCWPTYHQRVIQYRGVWLDCQIPISKIMAIAESGSSSDPLLDCVVALLPGLPASSGEPKW